MINSFQGLAGPPGKNGFPVINSLFWLFKFYNFGFKIT